MSIFDEVKSQLNIRQVIEHYGFKVNRAHQFVCPFHNDHKPSASIKNDYFHCFVCGAGGDLITFTAKYLGMSNIDACKELVREFGLDIDISTKEERQAQYRSERKRKEEIKACSSLRDKFAKDKELRSETKKPTLYKLRNDIRKIKKKQEQEQQEYIRHVGLVLASYHCYLWQGIHLYPFEHKRHIRGLQELTTCEYFLDCYDENPAEFCKYNMGVVRRYEQELSRFGRCGSDAGGKRLQVLSQEDREKSGG